MKTRTTILLCLVILFTGQQAAGANIPRIPDPQDVLSTLDRSHPRLFLNEHELERLKKLSETDPVLQKCLQDVLRRADAVLERQPLEYRLQGPRLLSVSRDCLGRIYSLGVAWRFTGDEKYAGKIEENLLTVCAFKDWNPSHFLDVAEMTHAVALGYDWVFDYLSDSSREKIRQGLIKNGLKAGVAAYTGAEYFTEVPIWWVDCDHNWNQVCNLGLVIGALAVAETDPEYAQIIIPKALEVLPIALKMYGPDGAWGEGPGYWSYATHYTCYGMAALDTALGDDFGLPEFEGFSETGFFPVCATGPNGLYLNFADSGERNRRRTLPALFWLAGKFNNRFFSDKEHEMIAEFGAQPQHIIWYVPPSGGNRVNPELDRLFRGAVEVAFMRNGWYDPDALFVGVKAGYNEVNHAHLDLGNFELDALGVRWARDLGSDDYNMPGYFGSDQRWTYYRIGTASHNVPMLNNKNQDLRATSEFIAFETNTAKSHAVVDLTSAYLPTAKKVTRGIALVDNKNAVLVQDEFELAEQCEIAWGMTTDAEITVNGSTALLTLDGKELTARLLSPQGASFTVESAEQKPPERSNTGVSRLMVRLRDQTGNASITVLLSPHWEDRPVVETAELQPIAEW